jgi:hypothetical protein
MAGDRENVRKESEEKVKSKGIKHKVQKDDKEMKREKKMAVMKRKEGFLLTHPI